MMINQLELYTLIEVTLAFEWVFCTTRGSTLENHNSFFLKIRPRTDKEKPDLIMRALQELEILIYQFEMKPNPGW